MSWKEDITKWLDERVKLAVDEAVKDGNAALKADVQVMIIASEQAVRNDVRVVESMTSNIVNQIGGLAKDIVGQVLSGFKDLIPHIPGF